MVNIANPTFPLRDSFAQLFAMLLRSVKFIHINGDETINPNSIQTAAYKFIYDVYKFQGNPSAILMQKYISRIDVIEIGQGALDLSSTGVTKNETDQSKKLILVRKNSSITSHFLKSASIAIPDSLSDALANMSEDKLMEDSEVINLYTKHIYHFRTLLNYYHALSMVCSSQSLYIFSYHIQLNPDHLKTLDFLIKYESVFKAIPSELDDSITNITNRLMIKFSNIFLGNLTSKIFNEDNYSSVSTILKENGDFA